MGILLKQGPFEIKTRSILILILLPTSLRQCPLKCAKASLDNEHFSLLANCLLFIQLSHVGNIKKDFLSFSIAFHEVVNSLGIDIYKLFW